MTLIVALPVNEGIVIASDGQVTIGAVRDTAQKIYSLSPSCAWSAAGELALIQRVEENLNAALSTPQLLRDSRPAVSQAVKQAVTSLLNEDFRTQYIGANPEALLTLHPGEFVFAESTGSGERVLQVQINGTSDWVTDRPLAIGSGSPFAYALLGKYDLSKVSLLKAKILAMKVIQEAIDVGAYGLGPPLQMYELSGGNAKGIAPTEIAALSDVARTIREAECSTFYDIPIQFPPPTPPPAPTYPDPDTPSPQ